MKDVYNIIIAGVGGQGVLTIAAILGRAALKQGLDIKASELHGLAMRFGSLQVHIRIGKKVSSPLIAAGSADVIIAHEPLESLKSLKYANKNTVIMFDTRKQVPNITYSDKIDYPSQANIVKMLKQVSKKIIVMDASNETEKATGSTMLANSYILGRLLKEKVLPLSKDSVLYAMKLVVPEKSYDNNLRIFTLGLRSK